MITVCSKFIFNTIVPIVLCLCNTFHDDNILWYDVMVETRIVLPLIEQLGIQF